MPPDFTRDFHRVLILRAAGGLALVLGGAATFAALSPDSWLALPGLAAHFAGLLLLYAAIRIWMERFGGRTRMAASAVSYPRQGCGVAALRVALIALMVIACGAWLWLAFMDLNEVRLLVFDGRHATAQVIGRDIVPSRAPIGYIDYSYRASPTLAPQDRFAVPHGDYARYRMGERFEVIYAAGAPMVHRIGRVDWLYALRRLAYWLLLLLNGGAYLFLPLWLLEFRRRPGSTL